MTEYVCWKHNILNEKIFPDLCKAIAPDTIDLAKGKDSQMDSWPQIASIGSDGIISNRFQIFVDLGSCYRQCYRSKTKHYQ